MRPLISKAPSEVGFATVSARPVRPARSSLNAPHMSLFSAAISDIQRSCCVSDMRPRRIPTITWCMLNARAHAGSPFASSYEMRESVQMSAPPPPYFFGTPIPTSPLSL